MAESWGGDCDEADLKEVLIEVADKNGGEVFSDQSCYQMVSPTMKVADLKSDLEVSTGIAAAKSKLWLCLPDDFPLHLLQQIPGEPQLQLFEIETKKPSSAGSRRAGGQFSPLAASAPVAASSSSSMTSSSSSSSVSSLAFRSMPPAPSPPPLPPTTGSEPVTTSDTFIRIGRAICANSPDTLLSYCRTLDRPLLLLALPCLIAYNNALINDWLGTLVGDTALLHRMQLLCHRREPFKHLSLPPFSDGVIQLCEENSPAFEKGQKHRWVGLHPISAEPVKAVKVDYVFSSLARPVILSYYSDGQATVPCLPRTICKTGEDIYNETAVQIMFRLMDEVWRQKLPPRWRPHVYSFNEVPGGVNLGYVELREGCCDIEDVERGGFELVKDHEQFFVSQCGTILATYLLGIEDRHRENTLFHKPSSTAFPIDFGFMLGLKPPSTNCYCVAVSPHLYKYLKKRKDDRGWGEFTAMFLAGFAAIRQEAGSFIAMAKLVFRGVPDKDENFIETFLNKKLLMGVSALAAMQRMANRMRHAPICIDTAAKINNHQSNKKFLDNHRDNFLVKKIIQSAVEAKPQTRPGRVRGHIGKASLQLPKTFPGMPADIETLVQQV